MSTLLYITYIDFGEFQSGSSVRPQMMYDAFCQLGWEVKLLQTQQNKKAERCRAVAEINEWLDHNRPDFCYVESPSGPIFQSCDRKLLRRIHRMGIWMGYFYRDAYFKFAHLFGQTNNRTLREKVIAYLSNQDLKRLKQCADLVYFPTETMASYFDFPHTAPLPPACVGNLGDKRGQENQRRSIYVGGISKSYGSDTMLKAFDLLNPAGTAEYPLTIVCRKTEAGYLEPYRDRAWLTVLHVSGKDNLKPLYEQANLALRPVEKNEYNDFAFSVKLTEYMEFGLPVVSVDTVEVAKFIERNRIGLVCRDDPQDFAEKVREILGDSQVYQRYCAQVYEAVSQGNRWVDRAQTVVEDFHRA